MPPQLGQRYPITYNAVPAHMATADFAIWQRFRNQLPSAVVGLYFDVRLGAGRPAHPDVADHLKTMWQQITTKRADVVIELPTGWLLVELRDAAQLNAVGRLLGYAKLWRDDPPDSRPLNLMLVTNNLDPDVEALAKDHGIGYLVT